MTPATRSFHVESTALFEKMADSVACYERDGTIAYVNPAACELFGCSREALIGQALSVLSPEPRGDVFHSTFEHVTRTGETRRFEHFHALWGRWYDSHVYLADERVWVIARDITQEKRNLERVEEARQQLATITDALPVLVCLVDDQLCYRFVNAGYERWFGQTRESLIGKSIEQVLGAEAFAAVEPQVRSALAGNRVTFEARVPYAVAGTRHIRSTNTPYRVDGRVKGYIALVQDISVEKAHEAELRAAIATRDEFLSIASHELRTPLTALALQLDGLERALSRAAPGSERDKTARKVAMALRQADRLASLIDGLLNVSRIGNGRFLLELQAFDMVGLVHEVAQRFDEEAERVGSVVSVNVPDAVLGRWDRSRVDQALTNLLSNALKYGAGGAIDVSLVDPGEHVQITVRDEGIGIAPEDRERVLGRFERAVSSSHYGGLGLGLYIADEIVRAHGGRIDIDSQPGRGATFTLSLPRQR